MSDERPTDPRQLSEEKALRRISWQAANEKEAEEASYLVKVFLRMPPHVRAALLVICREMDQWG